MLKNPFNFDTPNYQLTMLDSLYYILTKLKNISKNKGMSLFSHVSEDSETEKNIEEFVKKTSKCT